MIFIFLSVNDFSFPCTLSTPPVMTDRVESLETPAGRLDSGLFVSPSKGYFPSTFPPKTPPGDFFFSLLYKPLRYQPVIITSALIPRTTVDGGIVVCESAERSTAMNPKRELDDLHFQLATLYRNGADSMLIEEYWADIEMLEELYGPVGGYLKVGSR